jgi:hypothetical protein
MSATILPKLFFPAMEPTAGLLASLATFGVGLAARPLGAIPACSACVHRSARYWPTAC